MNANELADELDYCYGKEYPCPVSKEAATMLRQQQAEIEALKEELDKQGKMIPFTESEIKYSKPQFPNKPVGWWDGNHKNVIGISKTKECEDWIPLYTHPVKELTDEEIYKIANEIEAIQPQHGLKLSNDLNVMDFARAILRKAQDK